MAGRPEASGAAAVSHGAEIGHVVEHGECGKARAPLPIPVSTQSIVTDESRA